MVSLKILIALATVVGVASATSPAIFFETYPMIFYGLSMGVTNSLHKAWQICGNNTDQGRYWEVVKATHKCFNALFDRNQSICHNIEDNVQKCSESLVDYFVDCLPEKSKDTPPAIAKSAASLVEAFCSSSGELLLEASNECVFQYLDGKIEVKEECKEETLQPKLNKFNKEFPSKSEGCQVFTEIGDCWKESVNEKCENPIAKQLVSKIYNALLAPCNKAK